MKVTVEYDGRGVCITRDYRTIVLTAQEAYELHERLGAILPQLVQPFKPIDPDEEAT